MAAETKRETEAQRTTPGRRQVLVALAFGAVLTLVSLVASVLGGAERELFGPLGRNYLHDAVHVLTGVPGPVAGVVAGGTASVEYNRYAGVVYLLVFGLGAALLAELTEVTGLIDLNRGDNVPHPLLGAILAGVGSGSGSR